MTSPIYPPRDIGNTETDAPQAATATGALRVEYKYLMPAAGQSAAALITSRMPSLRMGYPARRVSSVYFDTAGYTSFHQSNSGMSERLKLRLRWYDRLQTPGQPVLELKHRINDQGWKSQHRLAPMVFDGASWETIRAEIRSQIGGRDRIHLDSLRFPVLIGTYHRHYFITHDRALRVTVDTGLYFLDQRRRPSPNFNFNSIGADFAVVECKFDRSQEHAVARILDRLRLRRRRFSKYCFGLGALSGL